nr:RtcB family protein [Alkalilimnicola ehrlichii]
MGHYPRQYGRALFHCEGLGNEESFCTCSHGAGRVMSRTEAKKRVSVEQHAEATQGVECRKDAGVVDETPAAYKDIDAVMAAQKDLVEIVYTLKQVVCVKG